MNTVHKRKPHIIEAKGRSFGRIVSQTALLLRGKNKAVYSPHYDCGDIVIIKNVKQTKITGKKFEQKKYFHYSGYPGGLKTRRLSELWEKNPQAVFLRALKHMLPNNTLRRRWMKRISFVDDARTINPVRNPRGVFESPRGLFPSGNPRPAERVGGIISNGINES